MKSSGNRFLLRLSVKRIWLLSIGLICALAACLMLPACSTDVDVNAPYETRAVIYGLLDPTQSVNYIRIQKAFLNIEQPDALIAAKVKDSIYFPLGENLVVKLFRDSVSGSRIISIPLPGIMERVEATGKDTGIFYSPDYIVYRYTGPLIPEDSARLRSRYGSANGRNVLTRRRIRLEVTNGRGYQAIARTHLVYPIFDDEVSDAPDDFHLISPQRYGTNRNLATVRSAIQFNPFLNGAVYKIIVGIPYEEVNFDGSHDTVEASWTFMSEYYANVSDRQIGLQMTDPARKYEFFEVLRGIVDTNRNYSPPGSQAPNSVVYRRLLPLKIRCIAADSALASYIQISNSYSAITQTKPFFTNVTNGLGLLASRTEKTFQAKADTALNGETMKTFNTISRYRSLRFQK